MFEGKILREIRTNQNISQTELGRRIGVTKVSVCGYENGTRTPSLETLSLICRELKKTPNDMLGFHNLIKREDNEIEYISDEEIKLIQRLRLSKDLYYKLINEPRIISYIQKKLK